MKLEKTCSRSPRMKIPIPVHNKEKQHKTTFSSKNYVGVYDTLKLVNYSTLISNEEATSKLYTFKCPVHEWFKNAVDIVIHSSVISEVLHHISSYIVDQRSKLQHFPRDNLLVGLATESTPFLPITL